MLERLDMNRVDQFSTECRKFAWSPENKLAFYKCEENVISIYICNKKKMWYTYQFGSESVIKHVNWSDLGENLVITADSVIVFNVYTKEIEFRYITGSGKISKAYLLKNRKLLIELYKKKLELINHLGQIEITYYFTAYEKYKDKIFLLLNGVIYTLDNNFQTIDQYVISFSKINSFTIYNKKVYHFEENKIHQLEQKAILSQLDQKCHLDHRGHSNRRRQKNHRDPRHLKNHSDQQYCLDKSDLSFMIRGKDFVFYLGQTIDSFQISKHFLFTQRSKKLRVYNKHNQEDIFSSYFSDLHVDVENELFFILYKGILTKYEVTKEDYSFKLIKSKKLYIEEEHEFDIPDNSPDIHFD